MLLCVIQDHGKVTLELVELCIKGQYVGRSDMWRVKQQLQAKCVYINKEFRYAGIRARIGEMWANECQVSCGLIGKDTTVVFRSSSTQMHVLVQMSKEMWDLDWNGYQLIEKAADFFNELFEMWQARKCAHTITIVLFSRNYYKDIDLDSLSTEQRDQLSVSPKGDFYQDFYRVVADARSDWDAQELLLNLKKEFLGYDQLVTQASCFGEDPGTEHTFTHHNSSSEEGNVLEAINMSLNGLDAHYVNRNFVRTGLSIMMVSGGNGRLEASRNVVRLTKRRIIDDGIGCDLVCLAEPALHITPVFRWPDKPQTLKFSVLSGSKTSYRYEIPQWIHQMYYTAAGVLQEGKRVSHQNTVLEIDKQNNLSPSVAHYMTGGTVADLPARMGTATQKPPADCPIHSCTFASACIGRMVAFACM